MDVKHNPWLMLYVLFTCLSFRPYYLSLSLSTISLNRSLSGDQTLSSEKGNFVLGFFRPGSSSNYYIGIWYNTREVSQRTVVWVANRENPVLDKDSSTLEISNGNLVLLSEAGVQVWSTDLSSKATSSSVEAILLDDGNLVLRDGPISIWQSFDHPGDTYLPGMRRGVDKTAQRATALTSWKSNDDPAPGLFSLQQDPNGTSQFLLYWKRSKIMWSSGSWDGQSFSLVPEMRSDYIFNFSYVSNENESYFTYSLSNKYIVARCLISVNGQIQQQIWLSKIKQWYTLWSQPRRQCEVYAYCGKFGICHNALQFCECLPGFRPSSENEWSSKVYSAGCTRKTTLQCGNSSHVNGKSGDGFLPNHHVLLPSNAFNVKSLTAQECESACLNNCSCIAYAYYNTNCLFWSGDILNLRLLAVDEPYGETLYIRLAASELSSSISNKKLVIGLTTGSAVILLFLSLVLSLIMRRRRRRRRMPKIEKKSISKRENKFKIVGGGQNDTQLALFSFKTILAATNKFSEANKLGEGGFGPVYKGNLPGDQQVAIKRLSKKSGQGVDEFMNELKLIANLQHKYLVRLLGCCVENEEKMLIYEYMPNRSLDKFLFDPSKKSKLVWEKRFKIAEGVAQGLLYIHKFSRLKIIHRDLKASNVLLDEAMNPKISDFGMARIFDSNQSEANTNRVVGTYGYMSPEYAFSGQFSEKSDVFSFGVFLLEIVSGRRNTSFHRSGLSLTLLSWTWELWKEGKEAELIDEMVKDKCCLKETEKCIHVGLLCVQEDPSDRPTMLSVVLMLTTATPTLPSPKEPAFHSRKPAASSSSSQRPYECSNNEVTVSLPAGR